MSTPESKPLNLAPGIYPSVNWSDYCRIPYPSPSLLQHGVRSMKRLNRAMKGECQPDEKTTAVGTCVHAIVSGEFEERCALMPAFETHAENLTKGTERKPPKNFHKQNGDISANGQKWIDLCKAHGLSDEHRESIWVNREKTESKSTDYYQESVAKFTEDNAGKTILTQQQFHDANQTCKSIKANPKAMDLIERAELEVTVIGEVCGVLCKTRLDGLIRKDMNVGPRAWDLKTTDNVEQKAFYRRAKKLRYFFRFAMHTLILQNAGDEWVQLQQYDIIAAESEGDYDCGVLRITEAEWDLIDQWERTAKRVVECYAMAKASDVWPGLYPMGDDHLEIPDYDMAEAKVVFEG